MSLSRPAARRAGALSRIAWTFAALVALVGSIVITVAPAATASTGASGPATMLILDASGSMVRDAQGGGTRMEQARRAASTFVASLADEQTLGLMVFGTKTGNDDSERAAGCRDVSTLFPLGPVDKAAMTASIDGIRESGFTPLGLAVETAAKAIGDREANIVLVSDGVDVCAPPPSCERAKAVKQQYPKLTIHAIGFAVDADEAAQEELNCIASVGGGSYVTASNAEQLASQLQWATDPTLLEDTVAPGGVNGLRIGMSLDEARAAEPGLVTSDPTVEIVYAECDYATMRFVDGRLYDIYPKAEWPTAEGLTTGVKIDVATGLYGQPYRSGTGTFGTFNTYPVTAGSQYGYRVYYDANGIIIKIVVCGCGPGTAPSTGSSGLGVEASFAGIGDVTIGMTAQAFLDAYPDAKYWQGEGFTSPLGTFADSLPQGEGLGHSSTCPMTSSPYADPPDRVPLEVFIIDGTVHGISTFLLKNVGSTTGLGNGLTTSSTIDEVAAVYGHVSVFHDYEGGERWVVSDHAGQTIQFTVDQGAGIGSVSVLSADYTIHVRPRDWFPCGPVVNRIEGRI